MSSISDYVAKIETSLQAKISDVELVSSSNNIVIKYKKDDKTYFAKFYRNNATHVDNEVMLYEKMPEEGKKYLKNLVYSNFSTDDKTRFAIFEEVKGKTLAEMLENNEVSEELADRVAKAMLNYFSIVSRIRTNKYGNLENGLEGKYDSYLKYLYEYQFPTTETLFLNKKTRKISSLPYTLLGENAEFLDEGYSCVTPIDSNFKNIMITERGEIKIIDPGAIVSAPLNMGLGELVAHSYGTIIYDKLMENMQATESQKRKLSIYGILSSLNVMAFLVRNRIGDIEKSKPFGNTHTFFELIEGHLETIERGKEEKKTDINNIQEVER